MLKKLWGAFVVRNVTTGIVERVGQVGFSDVHYMTILLKGDNTIYRLFIKSVTDEGHKASLTQPGDEVEFECKCDSGCDIEDVKKFINKTVESRLSQPQEKITQLF